MADPNPKPQYRIGDQSCASRMQRQARHRSGVWIRPVQTPSPNQHNSENPLCTNLTDIPVKWARWSFNQRLANVRTRNEANLVRVRPRSMSRHVQSLIGSEGVCLLCGIDVWFTVEALLGLLSYWKRKAEGSASKSVPPILRRGVIKAGQNQIRNQPDLARIKLATGGCPWAAPTPSGTGHSRSQKLTV